MTISTTSIIAFAFAMFILAITPGPAFFSLTARSITSGVRAGVGVVAGIIIADLIYFALALIGMSAISEAAGNAFIVIKIVAALYLVWLGVKMWKSEPVTDLSSSSISSPRFLKNFIEGLAVNLTNPKAILFFAALLPTFVNIAEITLLDATALMTIVVIVGGSVDLVYVSLAVRVRKGMRSIGAQTALNRIGGATLIGVGAGVAAR